MKTTENEVPTYFEKAEWRLIEEIHVVQRGYCDGRQHWVQVKTGDYVDITKAAPCNCPKANLVIARPS